MMRRTAVVIGAGLIGTTTAWFLAQRDFDVTVVERRIGPGLETSFANGGLLTPSQADPWNAPGILARAIRWLGRENSPLLLRPQAVPGMLGWGWRFLRASRPRPHLQATRARGEVARRRREGRGREAGGRPGRAHDTARAAARRDPRRGSEPPPSPE